jgi:predicted adenine nucleotide alpha hydrolase (AANH) superfamily ATPase
VTRRLERQPLMLPSGRRKVLLHSCCAPYSGEITKVTQASGIDFTMFFYSPNIHLLKEYELRKNGNIYRRHLA